MPSKYNQFLEYLLGKKDRNGWDVEDEMGGVGIV